MVLSSRITLSPRVVFSHVYEERRVLVFGDYVGVVVGGIHQSLVKAVEYAEKVDPGSALVNDFAFKSDAERLALVRSPRRFSEPATTD